MWWLRRRTAGQPVLVFIALLVLCCSSPNPRVPGAYIGVSTDATRYAVGSTCTIRFSTNVRSLTHVNLELSRDGGTTWEMLAASVPLPYTDPAFVATVAPPEWEHLWTITDGGQALPQTSCLIRVSNAADSSFFALSRESFVIRAKTIWHVDAGAPPGGYGLSWATALSHPHGLDRDLVAVGDEVWVKEGTYTPRAGSDEVVLILSGVAFYGGFAGIETVRSARDWVLHPTILDGQGSADHVVSAYYGVLDGFVLIGGNASGSGSWGGGGGGIVMPYNARQVSIANCVITGNIAALDGGGVSILSGSASLENCVVAGNSAGSAGGGLFTKRDISVLNCTFTGNTANIGAGIGDRWTFPTVTIANSILWGNIGDEIAVSNAIVTYSDVEGGYAGTGNIDVDPLFVNTAGADFRLSAGSPCIDAADGDAALSVDLDGNLRVDDPATTNSGVGTPPYADMGAYEYQP